MMLWTQQDSIERIPPEARIRVPAVDVVRVQEAGLASPVNVSVSSPADGAPISVQEPDFLYPEPHEAVPDGRLFLHLLALCRCFSAGYHVNQSAFARIRRNRRPC